MTLEELGTKLGLVEVPKSDKWLLEWLLDLYNAGSLKSVSLSSEEVLLQSAEAYLRNELPNIDGYIYED
jgi:hypothetical protein